MQHGMANAKTMVEAMRSNESTFCRGLVSEGFLSRVQMEQAAERYRLGKSRFDVETLKTATTGGTEAAESV